MAALNKVVLIGNLTRDPELRSTPKGTPFCLMGLAVNRRYKDDSGNARDETTFVDIEAWGRQAELASKYLKCGSPAFVEGRLKLDQWEDKQSGQRRNRMKVVMENIQFLSPGPGRSEDAIGQAHNGEKQGRRGEGRGRRNQPQEATEVPLPTAAPGEDVPF